jgi:hypothetical protein
MPWTRVLTLIYSICVTVGCTTHQASEPLVNTNAASSGIKTAKQSPSDIDPCTLLTKEDAESALGGPVKKITPQGLSTAETCQYLREKAEHLAQAGESVTLQVHWGGGKLFDSYVTEAEKSFETRGQQVEGVGDNAVFNSDQFIVLSKDDFFVVTIGKRMSTTEKLAASKALAAKVLARL